MIVKVDFCVKANVLELSLSNILNIKIAKPSSLSSPQIDINIPRKIFKRHFVTRMTDYSPKKAFLLKWEGESEISF